jgi:peptidoglycan/xylan/chitin deacetylase (PgdA/CDA1 family)
VISFVKRICYTLDLEEDHAGILTDSYEGLQHLDEFIELCNLNQIHPSIFVQAKLIERLPEKIETLRRAGFDLHLHSYSHPLKRKLNDYYEIQKSVELYRDFFGRSPTGYRFPQGDIRDEDYRWLREFGLRFSASVFPTIRPGYFNNLSKPLFPYMVDEVLEIPFAVLSEVLRIPVSISYMKLVYPLHLMVKPSDATSVIVVDLHLHDLYDLKATAGMRLFDRIPYMRKRRDGVRVLLDYHRRLMAFGFSETSMSRISESMYTEGRL